MKSFGFKIVDTNIVDTKHTGYVMLANNGYAVHQSEAITKNRRSLWGTSVIGNERDRITLDSQVAVHVVSRCYNIDRIVINRKARVIKLYLRFICIINTVSYLIASCDVVRLPFIIYNRKHAPECLPRWTNAL